SGELTLAAGSTLTASGAGASFAAGASAFVSGANLYALNGGILSLPGATEYTHAGTGNDQHRVIRAQGSGSRIEMPGLTSIAGGTCYDSQIQVDALAGGKIQLPGVTAIEDPESGDSRYRQINVTADGTGSEVDLSGLTSYVDRAPDAQWSATGGGVIRAA